MRLNTNNEVDLQDHKRFADYLLNIGEGKVTTMKQLGERVIELPSDICFPLTSISE